MTTTVASGNVNAFRSLGFKGRAPDYKPSGEWDSSQFYTKRGRPPEDQRGKERTPDCEHHYQGYVDECWPVHRRRRKAAIANQAPDRLTGEVKAHQKYLGSNSRASDAENAYMSCHINNLCIAMESPHLNTPDLEPLVVAYHGEKDHLGEERPQVKRIRDCGAMVRATCEDHGPRAEWSAECRLNYCPNCLPDICRDLDRARVPDIDPESGEAYRSVWLVAQYPLPESLPDWAGELVSLQKQFESTLTKIQRRKASKGCVLWRSFTAYYTLNEAWVHWKVMFKEGAPHGADDAVAELCRVMDSKVYDDRRYVHGELATLQLIENARTHLLGFSPDIDWEEKFELFAAHLDATKGRHVFQSMGLLWDLMRETLKNGHAAPEPMTCDVPGCGKRLKIAVHRDRSPSDEGAPPTTRGPDPPRRHQASGGAI